MENTIIINQDGVGINSNECHVYRLTVRMVRKAVKIGENRVSKPSVSRIELLADTHEGDIKFISKFNGQDNACNALLSLLEAIGREKMWDVREHNSGQGLDKGQVDIQGTEIASSGGKIEEEPTNIPGTVVNPSKC